MEHLEGLLRLVDKEFGDLESNGKFRNRDDIELAYKLIDIAKDVYCIWNYEDGYQEDEYSEYGRSYGRPMPRYPMDNGSSYARARNSRGQYTSREGSSYARRGGRGGNYSRTDAREEYMNNLRDMMMNAPDDRTREHVQRMIDELEQ